MAWTYSTNIMGPYGLWWFEKNNIPYEEIEVDSKLFGKRTYKEYEHWFGGRIDCYCNDKNDPEYDHYNRELYLPIMRGSSLKKLDEFLKGRRTDSLDFNILETFQKETGFTLEIFKDETLV